MEGESKTEQFDGRGGSKEPEDWSETAQHHSATTQCLSDLLAFEELTHSRVHGNSKSCFEFSAQGAECAHKVSIYFFTYFHNEIHTCS